METFILVLILLAIIIVSNIINRFATFLPVPLIQIGLGVLASVFPLGIHVVSKPELFFVLFVAPLLFNDGKRIPRDELWKLKAPILLLALGLVFVTVFIVGYVIHLLIPSIPLAAAFALAAILSPTDAVAVSSLSGRINLPKNILHLLEGEALMNDASGLVAFKFAIAAVVTGAFSLTQATISFFIISVGGLLLGALIAFLIIRFRISIRRFGIEDITMHMLIQLLTPFVIYLIAEHLGVSGILAVVAGGIVHAIERDHAESPIMELQVASSNIWSVILFILNGLVFVLLGLEIPGVLKVVFIDVHFNNVQVTGYILLISATLIFIRFVWIYLFWIGSRTFKRITKSKKIKLKPLVLTSLSGVRGAVTLAAAFSIPFVLQDGSPFPQRDLIIFLAAGVILVTLLIASILLPLISKKKVVAEENKDNFEQEAKLKIVQAAIKVLEKDMNEENRAAALSVISYYDKLIHQIKIQESEHRPRLNTRKQETDIRLIALMAEEKEIQNLLESGKINHDMAFKFQTHFNHMEMLLSKQLKFRLVLPILMIKRLINRIYSKKKKNNRQKLNYTYVKFIRDIKVQTLKAGIHAVENQINQENRTASLSVISQYSEEIEKIYRGFEVLNKDSQYDMCKKELHFKAIQVERDEVQMLYENGSISREVANKLRQFINHTEADLLEDENIAGFL